MKTLHSVTAIAAAALLTLTLAGCTPAADTSTDTGSGSGDTTTDESTTDDTTTDETTTGDFITLPGTGDYTVGVTAPIGGYELKDADSQPDGCTWALEDADGAVQFENQGSTVFITDVNAFFQTSGCPDWVQFE
jgi:hypothetical protein